MILFNRYTRETKNHFVYMQYSCILHQVLFHTIKCVILHLLIYYIYRGYVVFIDTYYVDFKYYKSMSYRCVNVRKREHEIKNIMQTIACDMCNAIAGNTMFDFVHLILRYNIILYFKTVHPCTTQCISLIIFIGILYTNVIHYTLINVNEPFTVVTSTYVEWNFSFSVFTTSTFGRCTRSHSNNYISTKSRAIFIYSIIHLAALIII